MNANDPRTGVCRPRSSRASTAGSEAWVRDSKQLDAIFARADASFLRVRGHLLETVPDLITPDWRADDVRQVIKRRQTGFSEIDYEENALAFNQAYFLRNLYKNIVSFLLLRPSVVAAPRHVVDVGAGAGAASLAWLSVVDRNPPRLTLVDRSRAQLQLAARVLSRFTTRETKVSFLQADFPYGCPRISGLRLMSYWACEQDLSSAIAIPDWTGRVLGDRAIILDYPEVLSCLERRTQPVFIFDCCYVDRPLSAGLATLFAQHSLAIDCCYVVRR